MTTNHIPFFCMKCRDNILLETANVQEENDERGRAMQTALCPTCQGKVFRFKKADDRKSSKERLSNIDETVGDGTVIDFDGMQADLKAGVPFDVKLFMKHTLFKPGSKTCMKMSLPAFEQVLEETIVSHPDLTDVEIINMAKVLFKGDHPQAFEKCIVPKYGDVTDEPPSVESKIPESVIPEPVRKENGGDECCTGVSYKALMQMVGKEKGPEREKAFAKEVKGLTEDDVLGMVIEEIGEERMEYWIGVIEGNIDDK